MRNIKLLLLMVVSSLLVASLAFGAEKAFHAKLKADEEVPPTQSKAKGDAEFRLSKDGKELAYKLSAKNITNPNSAHIHKGKKGQSGPPIVDLNVTKRKGKVSGLLSQGIISEKNLMGELKGKKLDDLVTLIKGGEAYVNVHTDANPDGEIRGQVK